MSVLARYLVLTCDADGCAAEYAPFIATIDPVGLHIVAAQRGWTHVPDVPATGSDFCPAHSVMFTGVMFTGPAEAGPAGEVPADG